MSDTDSTTIARGTYARLPVLTDENFADWDMLIIGYLTSSDDHICIITPIRQADNTFQEPAQPSAAIASATADQKKEANSAITSWQKSECVALGCIMMTASNLNH